MIYPSSRFPSWPELGIKRRIFFVIYMRLKDLKNGWMRTPSEWFCGDIKPVVRDAYVLLQWLIMNANIDDSECDGVEIKRGQVITSIAKIMKATGLTERQSNVRLNVLQTSNLVSNKRSNRCTIVTICNFDYYVGIKLGNVEPNVELNVLQTSNRMSNHHIKDNKDIRPGEYNTPLTPQGEGDSLSDFEILDDGYSTTKGRKEKVPRKRKELDTSFVAPEFKSAVDEWIAYKSELGKPYKARGFKAFYNQLVNLSGGDPDKARKIIEQSMANNWQGIFTINETKNGKSNRTNQIMPPDPEEVSRAIYEGIARARTPQEWEL